MKKGWRILLCVMAAAIVLLGVLALRNAAPSAGPNVAVKVEADRFSLGMYRMNEERSATFTLAAGDAIDVAAVHIGGELTLRISSGDNVVYQGRNPELGSFRVGVPADGEYTITVGGRDAEGSVSFGIVRNVSDSKEE